MEKYYLVTNWTDFSVGPSILCYIIDPSDIIATFLFSLLYARVRKFYLFLHQMRILSHFCFFLLFIRFLLTCEVSSYTENKDFLAQKIFTSFKEIFLVLRNFLHYGMKTKIFLRLRKISWFKKFFLSQENLLLAQENYFLH